jgi:precorrin-6B methylase 2
MLLGVAYYLACVARRGFYRGHQRFYATAQGTSLLARAAQALLTAPPAALVVDFHNLQESLGRDRISPMAAVDYSDDSLAGYADEQFGKGGGELAEQQRALALPMIERVAATLPAGATLIEIGTGNGDVCAHLAERFPALQVVGVDLSTVVAGRKHDLPNLRFVEGYALDLLEAGELDGELVFAASTFVVFTPLELARYCRALARHARRVILNEPTWGEHPASSDGPALSRHLELAIWHHNYAGYLTDAGFEILQWSCEPYQPPGSPRPDVRVTLLEGGLRSSR